MYFDPSYFKEEERGGFVIKPIIKRAWAAQLEVLKVIDEICKRHNINYFATFGTLLGAVRHQGFIPWDDDIDIGMLRKDFVRFQHYAKTELPEAYQLLSVHTGNYDQLIARVVNSIQISTEPTFMEQFHGCPYIVGIDIFIMDNIPLNEEEEEIQRQLISAVFSLQNTWNDDEMSEKEKMEHVREIETLCKMKFLDDKPMAQQLALLCDRLCAMYWDIDAQEVTFMISLSVTSLYRIPISAFDSFVEVPFDVTTIPIPIGYDHLLTLAYGENYMNPVHVYSHDYPFFESQQKALHEHATEKNIILPDYLMEQF